MSCDFCGKIFSREAGLIDHIYTYHMNVKFSCNLCPAEFRSDLKLKKHESTIHNKIYKCEKCNAAFGYQCDLVEHVKVKHKGKRYHCNYPGCLTTFTLKCNAKKHLHDFHSKKRIKKLLDRKEIISQVCDE